MDWLRNLPVAAMAVVIFAGSYVVTWIIYLVVTRPAKSERARVQGDLAGHAPALRRHVRPARGVPRRPGLERRRPGEHRSQSRSERAPRRGATLTIVPAALADALRVSLSLEPHNAGQMIAQRELVAAIQNALDARRQRIVLSGSSVNAVQWGALLAQIALMLVTIAMVHCDNPTANRVILAIFATGATAAVLLIAAYSRPFSGAIAVHPTPQWLCAFDAAGIAT